MSALRKFFKENAALAPLFLIVGVGIVASGAHLTRMATKGPDVVFDRKKNPFPWQNVQPDQNTKLMAVNQKFDKTARESY